MEGRQARPDITPLGKRCLYSQTDKLGKQGKEVISSVQASVQL